MENTGIKDKYGREILKGDKLRLKYNMITLEGYAQKNKDGVWEIYKNKGNHLDLKRLREFIEKL
jgi:hypothetical protein